VDNGIEIDDIDESDFLIRAQLDKEFICKLSGLVQAGQLAVLVTCSFELEKLKLERTQIHQNDKDLLDLSTELLASNESLISLANLSVRIFNYYFILNYFKRSKKDQIN